MKLQDTAKDQSLDLDLEDLSVDLVAENVENTDCYKTL